MVADREEVGADGNGLRMDDGVAADSRTEKPQIDVVERRPFERGGRALCTRFLTTQNRKYRRLQIGMTSCFHLPMRIHLSAMGMALKTRKAAAEQATMRQYTSIGLWSGANIQSKAATSSPTDKKLKRA